MTGAGLGDRNLEVMVVSNVTMRLMWLTSDGPAGQPFVPRSHLMIQMIMAHVADLQRIGGAASRPSLSRDDTDDHGSRPDK